MPLTQEKTVLSLRGITKQFPGVLANDDINFDLLEGEVHTILGENGAGKSTLMSIIDGIYQPDEGTISLYGEKINSSSPRLLRTRGSILSIKVTSLLIPINEICAFLSS